MTDQAESLHKPIAAHAPSGTAAHAELAETAQLRALGETAQALNARPAIVAQRALAGQLATRTGVAQRANRTGMPDQLKSGIESLSGVAMDDVRVHRNSAKPAQLEAHAYAQGSDIHLAPGQDHHLPHEAWHVVQQKQGRVRATTEVGGTAVNDDPGLEREADAAGARALQAKPVQRAATGPAAPRRAVVQRALITYNKGKSLDKKVLTGVLGLADSLDKAVAFATQFIKANPKLKGLGLSSGYLTAWIDSFDTMIAIKAIPEFFYARYGYAVETIAAAHMTKQSGALTVTTQYATGATRPDFVIWYGGQDIAWLDITSSASIGHIKRKQHSGWATRDYVAEVVYTPPQITDFKGEALTKEQKEALKHINTAAAQAEEDYATGLEEASLVVEEALEEKYQEKGKITQIGARTAVRDALETLLGDIAMPVAGEVVRCIDTIKVGDETASGAAWSSWAKFGGQGYATGRALLIGLGKKLRGGEGSMEEESSESGSGSGDESSSSMEEESSDG